MDLDILSLMFGAVVASIVAFFYFTKELKRRSDNNLTIEGIVHELRTPLTGINWIFSSLSELGSGNTVNAEILDLIKEGKNKIANAIGLTNDAMAALNTSADHASYKFEIGNLDDVIKKVIEENSLGAKEKTIMVEYHPDKDILPFSFDEIKIMLAIRNLVSNAIKYTPAGGRVSVETKKDGREVAIIVSDTGIGIPAVDMAKISNKFFRAKNIGEATGTGLGLFIVRNIVAGHGGRLDIQSSEGRGTKVTVSLPIK